MPDSNASPHVLLLLNCWGAGWDVLRRGCCGPRWFLEVVCILPVLDFLYANLALDQLIYIRHNHWALDVHQRKRRRWIPEEFV